MNDNYRDFDKLTINNELTLNYQIKENSDGSYSYYETISNKKIKNERELSSSLSEDIKGILKKQPIVAKAILKIIQMEHLLDDNFFTAFQSVMRNGKLFEKLLDRDTSRHLKNYGLNWNEIVEKLDKNFGDLVDLYSDKLESLCEKRGLIISLEKLDDKIEAILLEQKAKRLIQKVYSKSYRHLVDERTLDIFKVFVEKEISLSDINSGFGKKLARYSDIEESNNSLSNFMKELSGWNKEAYLKKAEKFGATIIDNDKDKLLLKIHSYEQSKNIGSGQWCIVYDKDYYMNYRDVDNSLFFYLDFSKDPEENTSMAGVVINSVGNMQTGYWRDDSYIDSLSIDENEREGLDIIKSKLPEKYTIEDQENAKIEIAVDIDDPSERNIKLLTYNHELHKINVLSKALKKGLFSNRIDKEEVNLIKNIYENLKTTPQTPEEIVHLKQTREFVHKYILDSKFLNCGYKDKENSPEILNEMVKQKDFETIKIYASKVDRANFIKILDTDNLDFSNKDIQNKILDIARTYKEQSGDIPFKADLIGICYQIKKQEREDKTRDFIKELFELNNHKIPLRHILKTINDDMKSDLPEFSVAIDIKEELIELALENINKEKLLSEFTCRSLKKNYPHVNKNIIKKINEKLKEQKNTIKKGFS